MSCTPKCDGSVCGYLTNTFTHAPPQGHSVLTHTHTHPILMPTVLSHTHPILAHTVLTHTHTHTPPHTHTHTFPLLVPSVHKDCQKRVTHHHPHISSTCAHRQARTHTHTLTHTRHPPVMGTSFSWKC